MAERKAISKRMRFEVLKRDSFTCQYSKCCISVFEFYNACEVNL